jgi:phosphomannomutase
MNGGRVLVRPSGTEPKLKVYVDLTSAVGERDAVSSLETVLGERARTVGKDLVRALGPLE